MIHKWIDRFQNDIKNNPEFIFTVFSSGIFITLLIFFPFYDKILQDFPGISDFSNHVMSSASAVNLNISGRIGYYLLFLCGTGIAFIGVFVLFYGVFHDCYLESPDNRIKELIRDSSLLGVVILIISILVINKEIAGYFLGVVVLSGWLFLLYRNKKKDFKLLIWSGLLSFPVAIYIAQFTSHFSFIAGIFQQIPQFNLLAVFLGAWVVISVFCFSLISKIIFVLAEKKNKTAGFYKYLVVVCSIPLLSTGVIQSLLLELLNIINKQIGIVIGSQLWIYSGVMILSLVLSFVLFLILRKRNDSGTDPESLIHKVYLPVILLTVALMVGQPFRTYFSGNEFFEIANHGLSVDHLFRYGSIPVVDTFDAHMLANQLFAYLYSIFNGYEPWAPFLYLNYFQGILLIISFFVLKRLIGPISSFLLIMCFPLFSDLVNGIFIITGLAALCISRMISTHKQPDFYLFWITSFLLFLYRADLGSSALLGGILAYFIIVVVQNEKIEIKKFFVPGIILSVSLIAVFSCLCLIKGLNPASRFIEFIRLYMSNQSWAKPSLGDTNALVFILAYYVLPLIVVVIAAWVIISQTMLNRNQISSGTGLKNESINKEALILFIFFTAFFIFNVSRGIVRHSFAEGTIEFILGTIPLALLSLSVIKRKSNYHMLEFFSIALIIVLLVNINLPSYKGLGASFISKAITSPSYQQQYSQAYSFGGTRVSGPILTGDSANLKNVLDTVLEPGETYFDFASADYFYALVERKNPVYVNQSPLMIADDATQECALEQIKKTKPPIVLMPITGNKWSVIDGIAVDYKYYMISEYIYANYSPMIRMPMFDIYCLKEKRLGYLEKLDKHYLLNQTLYDGKFGYLNQDKLSCKNCILTIDKTGSIVLVPNGNDPYVTGFMRQLRENNQDIKDCTWLTRPVKIRLEYYSSSVGNMQVYFLLKENDKYSEQQSKRFTINSTLELNTAVLNLPSIPYEIRIDVDTAKLVLEHLNISIGLQTIDNQPEIWVRSLGEIPRLWAEKDGNKMFASVPPLLVQEKGVSIFNADLSKIPLNEPMYVFAQIESTSDGTAAVDIKSTQDKLGTFVFNVTEGNHSYVIRLSTDYHWWNNEAKYLSISTSQLVDINKLCFISAVSPTCYNSEENFVLLSNLTDLNWSGGVGVTIDSFLFDYLPQIEKSLQFATELVFIDGSSVKILYSQACGPYIRVFVNEDSRPFVDVASYPNRIKIK